MSAQLLDAFAGTDHVGQADAELLVHHHHLAVGDQGAVDQYVQRLAGQAIEHDRADEPIDENTYFVMRNAGGAVFVKHGPFFVSQGGLTEFWGKNWKRIRAGSLKHARQVGEELLP